MLEKGDVKGARAASKKAAERVPAHPYYNELVARIAYQQGRYEDAEESMAKARVAGAKHWPAALELSGDIQYQLKNADEAVEYWEAAKTLGENSQRLLDKIANRSL